MDPDHLGPAADITGSLDLGPAAGATGSLDLGPADRAQPAGRVVALILAGLRRQCLAHQDG
ncbi:MAG: hypothetical protein ACKO6J_09330, partial [Crocinitomicaceae bacterium]